MATPLSTIKNWFKTGLKPTQAQFWATFESFRHKSEDVPISQVNGLQNQLDGKADRDALSQVAFSGSYEHLSNKPTPYIVPLDKFMIFKRMGNEGAGLEENDLGIGIVENCYIRGIYNASDEPGVLSAWNIIDKLEF
ncbi:hypothetical protein [Corallibacter sp.]|uniref:hypothetical protein n=1 Tax=Corallibacter sp. TaxID=2038084 RepID=UPI003A8D24C2